MHEIKAILIDDEPRGVNSMQLLLKNISPQIDIIGFCYSSTEAREKILHLKPQLIFLDIDLPGINGLDLLRSFSSIDFETIFVTAHNKYMAQAFHFSAVDYLLKPVDEELLAEAVQRAALRIKEKKGNQPIETLLHNIGQRSPGQKMKLCIPSVKGFQVVELRDIIYCEASGNYTNFHFTTHPLICASKPIHEYEELLADSSFLRIHKSFIVNLEHVKEYLRGEGGTLRLTEGHEVEVSRRKKEMLMTKMKEFYKF